MRHPAITLAAVLLIAFLGLIAVGQPISQPAAAIKVRIGTYDNRAIAVAYAASAFNPVREKRAEYEAAKKAGDEQKVKELETWGKQHQRLLHFQGFAHVPVGDLLQPVKEHVTRIAQDQRLAALVMECDYVAADVELVDVTDQLVELY